MSYFDRQRRMQREVLAKRGLDGVINRAVEMAATAQRIWNEELHPRGKTSPDSTPGSFAPRGGPGADRKWTDESQAMLKETQQTTYRKLYEGSLRTRKDAEAYAQAKMKKWLGPGYEKQTAKMVDRIWGEFQKNGQHRYFGPSHLREGWAVKCDIEL